MPKAFKVLLVSLFLVPVHGFAQNRDDSDSMFPPKTDSTLIEQGVIGVVEWVIFNSLHVKEHGLTPFSNQLNDSDQKVINAAQESLKKPGLSDIEREALKQKVLDAENAILERNIRVVNNRDAAKLRARGINRLIYAGQVLTVVDMFGRLYVWQKLDRDPGLSPVATFVFKSVSK